MYPMGPQGQSSGNQCATIACAPGGQQAETAIFSLRGSASGALSMLCSVSSLAAIASLRLSWLAASAVNIRARSMSSGVVTCRQCCLTTLPHVGR